MENGELKIAVSRNARLLNYRALRGLIHSPFSIFNSQFSIVQCVYNFFRSKIVARLYFMAKRM